MSGRITDIMEQAEAGWQGAVDAFAASDLARMKHERDQALVRVEALQAELARFASPVVDGRSLAEWRSVGVAAPWEPIIERLEARALAAETVLGRIAWWATSFGEELVPSGADTFGEGVRDATEKVTRLLADLSSMGGR